MLRMASQDRGVREQDIYDFLRVRFPSPRAHDPGCLLLRSEARPGSFPSRREFGRGLYSRVSLPIINR